MINRSPFRIGIFIFFSVYSNAIFLISELRREEIDASALSGRTNNETQSVETDFPTLGTTSIAESPPTIQASHGKFSSVCQT